MNPTLHNYTHPSWFFHTLSFTHTTHSISSSHDLYFTIISILQCIVANRNCVLLGKWNEKYKLQLLHSNTTVYFRILIGKLTIIIRLSRTPFLILFIFWLVCSYISFLRQYFILLFYHFLRYKSFFSLQVRIQVRRGI